MVLEFRVVYCGFWCLSFALGGGGGGGVNGFLW